jgi:uncharacterized membrane protein YedE/YeeE
VSAHWPFFVGGFALAAVMVGHWLALRRMMAVSGRYTAIVNRLRFGAPPADEAPLATDDLVAAMRAATAAEFGADALEGSPAPAADAAIDAPRAAQGVGTHVSFFAALAVGGLVAALTTHEAPVGLGLRGAGFAKLVHGSPVAGALVLLGGGVLVGFGTRMAGGCTSGHGLCGVSRFQPGSLLATAAFFASGVAVSFLLGWLS